MRTSLLMAAMVATLSLVSQAMAQEAYPQGEVISDYTMGSSCDSCGHGHGLRLHRHGCGLRGCGRQNCGHVKHRLNYEGLDRSFNCGCSGSYKFPVPPQNTYFWPGSTYSMDLMTNYHSPWRFPPLKPYTEETLAPLGTESLSEDGLRPISAVEEVAQPQLRPGQVEPMSAAMQRFFR